MHFIVAYQILLSDCVLKDYSEQQLRISIEKEKVIVKTKCALKWYLFFYFFDFLFSNSIQSEYWIIFINFIDEYLFNHRFLYFQQNLFSPSRKKTEKKQKWCEHNILKGAYFTRICA